MDDRNIVELYWQRDEEALQQTQAKYGAYLAKVSYNILSNYEDSQECVNDTYLAAWNSMPVHRPKILCTYLSKITRQLSIDVFRKRNAEKRRCSEYALSLEELGDTFSPEPTPEDALHGRLLDEAIRRFVDTLSGTSQRVFLGRYYFFDPLKDIAAYCGLSESRVKNLLYRTRQELKTYLQKEGFDL